MAKEVTGHGTFVLSFAQRVFGGQVNEQWPVLARTAPFAELRRTPKLFQFSLESDNELSVDHPAPFQQVHPS